LVCCASSCSFDAARFTALPIACLFSVFVFMEFVLLCSVVRCRCDSGCGYCIEEQFGSIGHWRSVLLHANVVLFSLPRPRLPSLHARNPHSFRLSHACSSHSHAHAYSDLCSFALSIVHSCTLS
jgi:hypothetical protein